MKVKLIVEGGAMKPGPAVAQQLGPMGINLGKVISDVNEATKSFKGVKVPVELDVNPKTKSYTIQVFSPPMSELIKKELHLEKGSGKAGSVAVGTIAIETAISVAKTKLPNLLAKDLKAAVKNVVGSCVSLGILVENKKAKDVMKEIDAGVYDKEIKEEKTEIPAEKKKKLDAEFAEILERQAKEQKAIEEAKAAAEAAKEAAKVAAGIVTAPTAEAGAAAPAAEAAKEEEKPAKEAKKKE